MPIRRLNHAVLYVEDLRACVDFYCEVLGFHVVSDYGDSAAFLQADGSTNDHDLGLFSTSVPAGKPQSAGLYHLAWEVETLADLSDIRDRLESAGALVGASDHSTTKSLYAKDPGGIEFEVCWVVPKSHLTPEVLSGRARIRRLDLEKEIERYGASLRSGIGISLPEPR